MKAIFLSLMVSLLLISCGNKDKKDTPDTKTDEQGTWEIPALLNSDEFRHEKSGDVNFYFKDISPEESQKISDYIVSSGNFSGGSAELYFSKEGDRIIARFPISRDALTDTAYISKVEAASKMTKDNVFADVPFSFYATDPRFATLKAWDY